MNGALAIPPRGATPMRASALPTGRATLPQRDGPTDRAAASDFKVLRTNRVPQQLSLFERPLAGR